MEIEGGPELATQFFKPRVRAAMLVLRDKAYSEFSDLVCSVRLIRCHTKTGADVLATPPTIDLSVMMWGQEIPYVASVLAHETCHHLLHLAGKPYIGDEAELICNAYGLSVMRKVGVSARLIAHHEKDDGKHWDVDGDGVYTKKDYEAGIR